LVALILVTLFRNDDDKNETDNDEDDRGKLNQWQRPKQAKKEPLHINSTYAKQGVSTLTHDELEQLKIKQAKRVKSKQLTREIVINLIFVLVLFITCYSNRDDNAYSYNIHLKTIFKEFNDVSCFFLISYF
jgi:hypothetical protein